MSVVCCEGKLLLFSLCYFCQHGLDFSEKTLVLLCDVILLQGHITLWSEMTEGRLLQIKNAEVVMYEDTD